MAHRFKILFFLILGLGIVAPQIPYVEKVVSVQSAHAQEKRKSLFSIIRERTRKRRERLREKVRRQSGLVRPSNQTRRNVEKKPRRTVSAPAAVAPTPEPAIAEKSENAVKVLIVGDFIASGIARELTKLYQANPNVVVVSKTSAASGIVRDDVINWVEEIPAQLEEHKPIAIVNLVGMNDRQAMRLPEGRVQEMTEPWMKAYSERVTKIAGSSVQYKVPMLWVGLPPVRFTKMNTDYLTFNNLYRSKVEAVGGQFIDVWDGFTNEEGKFVSAGPDVNGQIVRLRGAKGINMTRAGFRKLAFYVDKELRKFGISADAENQLISSFSNFNTVPHQASKPQYDPAKSGTTVVISLGAANPNNLEPLAGEKDFLKVKEEEKAKSVSFSLVEKGIGYEPKSGRIDAGWGAPKAPQEKSEEKADADKEKAQTKPVAANDNSASQQTNEKTTATQ